MCLGLNLHWYCMSGSLMDSGVGIDRLFHLDLSPISVVFPLVKMFGCERAHWRLSCLIGDGFNLSLFSFQTGWFSFYSLSSICIDSETTTSNVRQLISLEKVFHWWWLVVVKPLPLLLIGCNYLFLLILKSHWHEWCLIALRTESAID